MNIWGEKMTSHISKNTYRVVLDSHRERFSTRFKKRNRVQPSKEWLANRYSQSALTLHSGGDKRTQSKIYGAEGLV